MLNNPKNGTIIPVRMRPILASMYWLPDCIPIFKWKTRLPEPKNISNIANPVVRVILNVDIINLYLLTLTFATYSQGCDFILKCICKE
jgi:hypothetical protein